MPLQIVRNDITKMEVDVIVNAANIALQKGGGVCGSIFAVAGADKLQAECDRIGGCKVGEAVITGGYELPAKYIIHTVGPVWHGGHSGEARLLHNSYINSLKLAFEHKCKSIAFPLISSGIYGYPKDQALQIAIAAISEFLLEHEMMVYLVVFDKKAFVLSEKLFTAIEKFIDDNYVDQLHVKYSRNRIQLNEEQYQGTLVGSLLRHDVCESISERSGGLDDLIGHLEETFSEMLLRLIDEKGMEDVQVYHRANIDRRLFSKIRSNKGYKPSKNTAIAFAIALELNLDQTRDLLMKAGYALSRSSKFDVIIEYFIDAGNYNINEINEALFYYDQTLLGA